MLDPRPAAPTEAPPNGTPVEIAPGILWMRLPLPTRLNHVNIYIFEDEGGWTVFDAGMSDPGGIQGWEKALAGVLSGRPIKRLIISHFHRDHIGLASWLQERFAPEFLMSQTEYLVARVFEEESARDINNHVSFFKSAGLDPVLAASIAQERSTRRNFYGELPSKFTRLRRDQVLRIGGRDWRVLTGAGHAVEQVMLYCAADQLFISADQVLPEISPNVSVGSMLPTANPLGDFLASLKQIKTEVSDEAFVLCGHRKPFYGLHKRLGELEMHHQTRCAAVIDACRDKPLSGHDLIPAVFDRTFGRDVVATALGEAVAHANLLWHQKLLTARPYADGVIMYQTM